MKLIKLTFIVAYLLCLPHGFASETCGLNFKEANDPFVLATTRLDSMQVSYRVHNGQIILNQTGRHWLNQAANFLSTNRFTFLSFEDLAHGTLGVTDMLTRDLPTGVRLDYDLLQATDIASQIRMMSVLVHEDVHAEGGRRAFYLQPDLSLARFSFQSRIEAGGRELYSSYMRLDEMLAFSTEIHFIGTVLIRMINSGQAVPPEMVQHYYQLLANVKQTAERTKTRLLVALNQLQVDEQAMNGLGQNQWRLERLSSYQVRSTESVPGFTISFNPGEGRVSDAARVQMNRAALRARLQEFYRIANRIHEVTESESLGFYGFGMMANDPTPQQLRQRIRRVLESLQPRLFGLPEYNYQTENMRSLFMGVI